MSESAQSLDTAPAASPARVAPARPNLGRGIQRWSLPIVFVAAIVLFSILRPDVFPTVNNLVSVLQQNLPLLLVVAGLCLVLSLREFDLSFGFIAGAAAALAVQSMVLWHVPPGVAVLLAFALGGVLGLVNGLLVAFTRLPSFIGTLATGAAIEGVMLAISTQTVFQGIPESYIALTNVKVGGVNVDIVVVAVLVAVLAFVLRFTVFGRQATAIGDNPAAARIAGVNVRLTQVVSFTLVGICAGLAGVLITSQAAQYYPDPASGLTLPAFAAAYLSLSLGRGWRFNVPGAMLGGLFLAVIQTGVTMLNQPTWLGQLLQGVILLVAILALNRRRAA
ncbi:ABC transporter permease [Pseudolysinimonas sp.]|uniref:ABC transporter permease n=1 Tax=Pseudolysinimonas sp. TaxID=2680009 RepID=UPI003F7DE1B4